MPRYADYKLIDFIEVFRSKPLTGASGWRIPHGMKQLHHLLLSALIGVTGCAMSGDASDDSQSPETATEAQGGHGQPDSPMLGIHYAKGEARPGSGGGGSPLLVWQGGQVMPSSTVTAIFWGAQWANASFTSDKMTGLDTFYGHVGGTTYMKTNTEYTGLDPNDASKTVTVGDGVTYGSHVVDTSSSLTHAPKTSAINAEVCKMIPNPVPYGYYPVYTDLPRGHAGYCAWHSFGSCNGVPVQFGFFFDLDGDGGCDVTPQGNHSQGLESLANVSGHELSEMVTDPRNGGWRDSSGSENADKCAWAFPGTGPVTIGGEQWMIQGNWSNAAYANPTPNTYPNRSGQDGCLMQ
jgi:hypothetical protein